MNSLWHQKKNLLLLAGGVLLLGGITLLSGPLKEHAKLRGERASLLNSRTAEGELDRQYRQLKSDLAEIKQRLGQYGTTASMEEGVMIPAFIRHVETLAREEGLVVSSISPGSRVADPPIAKIPFQITVSGKFPPFHRFLYRLERSRPPVQVERVMMVKGNERELDVSITCSILSWEGVSGGRPAMNLPNDEMHMMTFQSSAVDTVDPEAEIGRDIFSYASYQADTMKPIKERTSIAHRSDKLGDPRLNAIFYDGSNSLAFLDGTLLRKGDTFKGRKVVSIERNRIVLANDQGVLEVLMNEQK